MRFDVSSELEIHEPVQGMQRHLGMEITYQGGRNAQCGGTFLIYSHTFCGCCRNTGKVLSVRAQRLFVSRLYVLCRKPSTMTCVSMTKQKQLSGLSCCLGPCHLPSLSAIVLLS